MRFIAAVLLFAAVVGGVNAGACAGSDVTALSSLAKDQQVLLQCAKQCITSSDFSSCASDCVKTSLSLSSSCAACFGTAADCAKSHCLAQCLDPSSAACISCAETNCEAALEACTGVVPTASFFGVNAGACIGADATALSSLAKDEQVLLQCAKQCISSSDFSSCASDCVKTALSLTSTCAACFGTAADCAKSHCLAQCLDPSSAACISCAETNCEAALEACTGVVPTQSFFSNAGACVGADATALSSLAKDEQVLLQCAKQCITSSDFSSCASDCVKTALSLTSTCAACFGTAADCAKSHCLAQCLDPSSAACISCAETNCEAALEACTGVVPTQSFFSNAGACVGADATKLTDLAHDQEVLLQCAKQCITSSDFSSCAATCVQTALSLTAQCAACFGTGADCAKAHCLSQCLDPTSAACISCAKTNCEASLEACTGVVPSTMSVFGVYAGACVGADATKLTNLATDEQVLLKCATQCISSSDFSSCAASCVQTALSLSAQCAACFGTGADCAKAHCLSQCLDPTSAACISCAKSNCEASLEACTGVVPSTFLLEAASTGACVDAADSSVIVGKEAAIQSEVQACAKSCLFNSDFEGCTDSCVVKATSLSNACAACFGASALCGKNNCALQCIDPSSSSCLSCVKTNCATAYETCSGLPWAQ